MFFQDELRVREDLLLTGGVRYDHYPSFGGTVNPRLALIYHPLDQTNFKFIYGRAFRAPNTYEVLREDVDLGPEKIKTFEVVYQQSHGKNLQGYISGFYYKIDGLITEVPSEYAFLYRNAEDIHAQGLESEVQARWSHGVRGSVNYTFADVTRESDQILPNSPRHLMKGNFVFPLVSEKMFLSATGQYMSSRKSRDGNKVEPYFLMDAVLGVNIGKKLEGSLGIYNLLDKTYYDPGSDTHRQQLIQQNGRTLLVKVTYAF
jgi:iron complex outermembrane receptor protein